MELLAFSFETVQGWISTGGFAVLFLLLFACGLGLPLPEDIPLIIAGALLVKSPTTWVIGGICAWCGIIGGDCVLYSLGRKFGLEITRVPFIGKHVTKERIQRVEELFNQYGVGVVAVGRLFAGIRGAMVVAAGATKFNFIKFIIADGLAAIVSGGMFMLLGHWLGAKLMEPETQKKIHEFKEWFFVGGVVLGIVLIAWIIWKRRHSQQIIAAEVKIVERAERAKEKMMGKIAHKPDGGNPNAETRMPNQ
ncbi:MAG TPA: DedA family protein [Tepidisphaeraceae bacterium]|nr:DedA family protein [Tepidisphaeraceae bacterium]